MNRKISLRILSGFWLGAVLTIALGCGSTSSTGRVSGTVKYKGTPVTSGDVNLLSKSGKAAQGKLDSNGGFTIDGPVETGDYMVFWTPPVAEPTGPGAKPAALPKLAVPPKFQDATSSGVVVTVKSGANEMPIDFKD